MTDQQLTASTFLKGLERDVDMFRTGCLDQPGLSLPRARDAWKAAFFDYVAWETPGPPVWDEIRAELARAKTKHPKWPADLTKAAAIMICEAGEALKEARKFEETGDDFHLKNMRVEIFQTAAMCLRLLESLSDIEVD